MIDCDNETIYEDESRWVAFDWSEENSTIFVYARCPECGKFIKSGLCFTNLMGNVKLEEWKCKTHGEVTPFYIVE